MLEKMQAKNYSGKKFPGSEERGGVRKEGE
jgi:hypothetical protein